MDSFWKLGDELRGQLKVSEDHKWSMMTSTLAELTNTKAERTNNLDLSKMPPESKFAEKIGFEEENKFDNYSLNQLNLDYKLNDYMGKNAFRSGMYSMNAMYPKSGNNSLINNNNMNNFKLNSVSHKYANTTKNKEVNNNNNHNNNNNNNSSNNNSTNASSDKRFKTLPSAEMLPRNEVLGGYIFVCNNDTMQEDLKRQLFGLPPRYRDSVRAITPGLPLFLYNYTTHQLHGIFEASSFGGSNIDPTAWEDKKCKGESRFPAQVRIRVRKLCKALEEDSFRPVLHHYDGPKFRLELSIPETLQLLDLCEQGGV